MVAGGSVYSVQKQLTTAVFYGVSSIAIMMVNKIVLTQYGFPSAEVVAVCQMVFTIIALSFAKLFGLVSYPDFSGKVFWQVFPLPLIYLGNLISGLGGTQLISLPMFTLLRRFSILMTMLAEKWMLGDDLSFNLVGYMYILVNDLLTAVNGVVIKKKLDSKELGSFGLMYYNCLFSLPFAVATVFLEPSKLEATRAFEFWHDPSFMACFLASCAMGFLLTYSIFICTQVNSALTTTVVGCLKNILVAYLGMTMADYVFSWLNFAGINLRLSQLVSLTTTTLLFENTKTFSLSKFLSLSIYLFFFPSKCSCLISVVFLCMKAAIAASQDAESFAGSTTTAMEPNPLATVGGGTKPAGWTDLEMAQARSVTPLSKAGAQSNGHSTLSRTDRPAAIDLSNMTMTRPKQRYVNLAEPGPGSLADPQSRPAPVPQDSFEMTHRSPSNLTDLTTSSEASLPLTPTDNRTPQVVISQPSMGGDYERPFDMPSARRSTREPAPLPNTASSHRNTGVKTAAQTQRPASPFSAPATPAPYPASSISNPPVRTSMTGGSRRPLPPPQAAPERTATGDRLHRRSATPSQSALNRDRSSSDRGKRLVDWSCEDVQTWLTALLVDANWRACLASLDGQRLAAVSKGGLQQAGITDLNTIHRIIRGRDDMLAVRYLNDEQRAKMEQYKQSKLQEAVNNTNKRATQSLKEDLQNLLSSLNLMEYSSILAAEGIEDLDTLREYSEQELRDLGFKGGHAKKLLGTLGRMTAGGLAPPLSDTRTAQNSHEERLGNVVLAKYKRDGRRLWEIPRHDIELGRLLGQGAFGNVHFATARHVVPLEESTKVAVKTLNRDADALDKEDFLEEIRVMQQFDEHPNVVRLLGICTLDEPMMLLVEYMPDGNMRDFLREARPKTPGAAASVTSTQMLGFLKDVAAGMAYIAGKRFVHRDLAARNVLLHMQRNRAAIADFGLSRYMNEEYSYLVQHRKRKLPAKWMAPECLDCAAFTTQSDVWAYGIVIWETVLMGAIPYPSISTADLFPLLMEQNYRMPKPASCSEELYQVMRKCWLQDPAARPDFQTLEAQMATLIASPTKHIDDGVEEPVLRALPTQAEDNAAMDATKELTRAYQNWPLHPPAALESPPRRQRRAYEFNTPTNFVVHERGQSSTAPDSGSALSSSSEVPPDPATVEAGRVLGEELDIIAARDDEDENAHLARRFSSVSGGRSINTLHRLRSRDVAAPTSAPESQAVPDSGAAEDEGDPYAYHVPSNRPVAFEEDESDEEGLNTAATAAPDVSHVEPRPPLLRRPAKRESVALPVHVLPGKDDASSSISPGLMNTSERSDAFFTPASTVRSTQPTPGPSTTASSTGPARSTGYVFHTPTNRPVEQNLNQTVESAVNANDSRAERASASGSVDGNSHTYQNVEPAQAPETREVRATGHSDHAYQNVMPATSGAVPRPALQINLTAEDEASFAELGQLFGAQMEESTTDPTVHLTLDDGSAQLESHTDDLVLDLDAVVDAEYDLSDSLAALPPMPAPAATMTAQSAMPATEYGTPVLPDMRPRSGTTADEAKTMGIYEEVEAVYPNHALRKSHSAPPAPLNRPEPNDEVLMYGTVGEPSQGEVLMYGTVGEPEADEQLIYASVEEQPRAMSMDMGVYGTVTDQASPAIATDGAYGAPTMLNPGVGTSSASSHPDALDMLYATTASVSPERPKSTLTEQDETDGYIETRGEDAELEPYLEVGGAASQTTSTAPAADPKPRANDEEKDAQAVDLDLLAPASAHTAKSASSSRPRSMDLEIDDSFEANMVPSHLQDEFPTCPSDLLGAVASSATDMSSARQALQSMGFSRRSTQAMPPPQTAPPAPPLPGSQQRETRFGSTEILGKALGAPGTTRVDSLCVPGALAAQSKSKIEQKRILLALRKEFPQIPLPLMQSLLESVNYDADLARPVFADVNASSSSKQSTTRVQSKPSNPESKPQLKASATTKPVQAPTHIPPWKKYSAQPKASGLNNAPVQWSGTFSIPAIATSSAPSSPDTTRARATASTERAPPTTGKTLPVTGQNPVQRPSSSSKNSTRSTKQTQAVGARAQRHEPLSGHERRSGLTGTAQGPDPSLTDGPNPAHRRMRHAKFVLNIMDHQLSFCTTHQKMPLWQHSKPPLPNAASLGYDCALHYVDTPSNQIKFASMPSKQLYRAVQDEFMRGAHNARTSIVGRG
ncbi:uncharacterized protein MONBRDRAFT_32678 [Monosiga brevicollis MX1]|uniref:Protein kinase domain-containing protein n=1 Tax=Monosiga brevicollis TaxID=81824 RepID=A9V127_MONBE|nr:uncharacterized protein MONBRDRAFT_32678 [Monosiga brevicollis MX1]EDQ88859.1 predicted protein [Monosiga brevicollis MX1]|eukprot:XP_001746472.1 hypothetical protein [Monosiga brevicollis MX1]